MYQDELQLIGSGKFNIIGGNGAANQGVK